MPSLSDLYYSREETARYLKLSVFTLDRWRKARKGPPATLLNRFVFYRKASLHQWLESKEAAP
jgi:hypothetical protein